MTTSLRRKMEWRRAWKALRTLIADSQRTDQAFEITDALAGNSFERSFERFCRHPNGRQLLAERPSLLATLSDRAALRALPAGSFGRAYVDFMEAGRLTADGLVAAEAMVVRDNVESLDPDRRFFGDRMRDTHDLFHVLTGYGMDEAGEAANLAFTLGQVPSLGIALIVVAAAVIGPRDIRLSWPRYLYQAWQRGRCAGLLSVAPYERLLREPLDAVRRQLGILPARIAHPDGILGGNRTADLNHWVMSSANH